MADPAPEKLRADHDLSVHIFTASAGMVGVCITVMGLFRISDRLRDLSNFSQELLAMNSVAFLASCILAYLALRTRPQRRRYLVEKWADGIFFIGLCLMAVICALIAYELI